MLAEREFIVIILGVILLAYRLPLQDRGYADHRRPPPGFRAVVTGSGRIHVVLSGELDVTTMEALAQLVARLADSQPTSLSIDLSAVSYLDCASARLLIGTTSFLPPGEYPVLISMQPAVRRLLELVGLAEVIEMGE
jgi:anti-anti-sigma factor